MNENSANQLANAIGNGAYAWHSGGGIWLVLLPRTDGSLVALSEEGVCEYASESDFDDGKAAQAIWFTQSA